MKNLNMNSIWENKNLIRKSTSDIWDVLLIYLRKRTNQGQYGLKIEESDDF